MVAALAFGAEHIGNRLGGRLFRPFIRLGGGEFSHRPERNSQLKWRHFFSRLSGRSVDRFFHRLNVVTSRRKVNGFRPNAECDIHFLAKQLARSFLVCRYRYRQGVEIHTRMASGVPLDAWEFFVRLLGGAFQLLQPAFELGGVFDQYACHERDRIGIGM